MPGQNLDEIGDKGRNNTLQNGTVPTDRVLLVDVRVVVLRHHCDFVVFKKNKELAVENHERTPLFGLRFSFPIFRTRKFWHSSPFNWIVQLGQRCTFARITASDERLKICTIFSRISSGNAERKWSR